MNKSEKPLEVLWEGMEGHVEGFQVAIWGSVVGNHGTVGSKRKLASLGGNAIFKMHLGSREFTCPSSPGKNDFSYYAHSSVEDVVRLLLNALGKTYKGKTKLHRQGLCIGLMLEVELGVRF